MFDRFTDKAKKSLNLAREAAKQCGHPDLAPEHILHGVLSVGSGGAFEILAANKVVGTDMLKDLSLRMPPSVKSEAKHVQLPFTDETKRVLERAMEAAKEAGHTWIGTEHLLVGLSQSTSGVVAEMFRECGLMSSTLMQSLRAQAAGPEDPKRLLEGAARIAMDLGDQETARRIEALIDRLSQ